MGRIALDPRGGNVEIEHPMAMSTPCIGVCTIEPRSGLCLGCGRTLPEVARWGRISEEERLAIMTTLSARLAKLDAATKEPGQR